MLRLLFLILSSSCALLGPQNSRYQVERVANAEVWRGRSGDELILHPVFATLPMESRKTSDGVETRSFKNSGGVASSSNCASYGRFGSCNGTSGEIACNHIFYITKNKISDYKRYGHCGPEELRFRPYDQNGNPVEHEMELAQRRSIASVKIGGKCSANFECQGGSKCQNKDKDGFGECAERSLIQKFLYP